MEAIIRIYAGHSVYARPYPDTTAVIDFTSAVYARPLDVVGAPVRDEAGNIIAVLALVKFADTGFGELMAVGRMGRSGETYAFGPDGVMLSESRFIEQLQQIGVGTY